MGSGGARLYEEGQEGQDRDGWMELGLGLGKRKGTDWDGWGQKTGVIVTGEQRWGR